MSKERILKLNNNSQGYLRVDLKVDGTRRRFFIHRLVAEHFITKPNGCDVVNHLDCNPHNNYSNNLEWTTLKGNSAHTKKMGRDKRTSIWIKRLQESLKKKMREKSGRNPTKWRHDIEL